MAESLRRCVATTTSLEVMSTQQRNQPRETNEPVELVSSGTDEYTLNRSTGIFKHSWQPLITILKTTMR